jgi:chromosome segregation ATPase
VIFVSDVEERLRNLMDTISTLESQLERAKKERNAQVADLEMERTKLANDLKAALESKTVARNNYDNNSPNLHHYWEEKTSKTKEVKNLKNDIEGMRQRVFESSEALKLSEQKVQDLKIELQKNRSVEKKYNPNECSDELKRTKIQVVQLEDEILKLKEKVQELNVLSFESGSVKKDFQETQAALVTLDDDKQAMHIELNDLVSCLEKEKKVRNEITVQLESQATELTKLQDIGGLVEPLQAENLCLQEEIKKVERIA